MVSLSPPMRPNGIPQMHLTRLIRLGPEAEPFTLVIGRRGLPVRIATLFLRTTRHLAASRQNKMASVCATVLDLLTAREVDPAALMMTGKVLSEQHVQDIVLALHHIGPRTAGIRRARLKTGESLAIYVGHAEHVNRIDIAKRFIVYWTEECLDELKPEAALYIHLRELIDKMAGQFAEEIFSVTTEARRGLEPAQLQFFDMVIHPRFEKNPWGEDRFQIFVICVLWRLLGHRAREPLLYQLNDVVMREGQPALRLLPTDTRADRVGGTISLKRGARHIRIPDWCAALLKTWIEVERPKIGERLEARGNLEALKRFRNCPYMFVSSRGTRLSSTTLYNRITKLRDAFPDDLPADFSPARLRNSRADEVEAAARDGGFDLSRVAEHLFGWVPNSPMLAHYAQMQAEREAGKHLRERANMAEGLVS